MAGAHALDLGAAGRGVSMSNFGQIVLGVVGLIASIYTMNPIWFTLAIGAGTLLFPTQLPGLTGPKLTDNKTTTASVGVPVPIIFGTTRVAGQVIWLAPSVEHSTTTSQGGKGGGGQSQTTYSYTQSIAIGLAEAVLDGGQAIGGLMRVWENGALVYDVRPQLSADPSLATVAETAADYSARIGASGKYAATFTLHLGNEAQVADPTIEAIEGFGNVPAFRGLAYIVYPQRSLQDKQGQRHPSFQFEVYSGPVNKPPLLLLNYEGNVQDSSGYNWPMAANNGIGTVSGGKFGTGALQIVAAGSAAGRSVSTPISSNPTLDVFAYPEWTIETWFNILSSGSGTGLFLIDVGGNINSPDGSGAQCILNANANNAGPGTGVVSFQNYSAFGQAATKTVSGDIPFGTWHHAAVVRQGNAITIYLDGVGGAPYVDFGSYVPLTGKYITIGNEGPASSAPMDVGLIDQTIIFPFARYTGNFTPAEYQPDQRASVGSIISALCQRAALSSIDASELDSVAIGGYAIAAMSNAANIIAPLRSVAFFDVCESGSQLQFRRRGTPIVRTLTADDIGAYDGGTAGATVPASMQVARTMDIDLPRSVRLHYQAISLDYQDGEQDSPFRLTTLAINDLDVNVPLSLSDTQALQAADVLWSDAWAARNAYTLTVDQAQTELEVGDCIAVPVDGVLMRCRIVSESNAGGVLRKLSLVGDDDLAYVSTRVAAPVAFAPPTLAIIAPTLAVFLDLPALRVADNDAGFYVAAMRDPASGNVWSGAAIYKSIDSGVNFSPVASVSAETTIGTIDTAIPFSTGIGFDTTTVITVNVPARFSFESRTDEALAGGANAAAVGANGRWEILQFGTATQVSATQWQLSRLIRAQLGTSMGGGSTAGDDFVLLSTGSLGRVVLQPAEANVARVYKIVSFGDSFEDGTEVTFTSSGKSLNAGTRPLTFGELGVYGSYGTIPYGQTGEFISGIFIRLST